MAKKFTLYWRDGKRQVVEGPTIAAACTSAGYGGGALRALDFWSHGDYSDWEWVAAERDWRPTASSALGKQIAALKPQLAERSK